MTGPLYSYIVTTYECSGKGASFVTDNLVAALAQTYRPLQIVVSDHSRDNVIGDLVNDVYTVLARAKNIELIYTRCTTDYGSPCANWEHGAQSATGDFVHYFAMDDRLMDEHAVDKVVQMFQSNPTAQWIACATITSNGPFSPRWNDCILQVNTIGGPSAVVLRQALARRVTFDKQFTWLLDLDWYYRLFLDAGPPLVLAEPIYFNRIHSDQLSNTVCNERFRIEENSQIRLKYGDPLPRS